MTTHICGLYFTDSRRRPLPLIDIEAHTTILTTTSRTVLTQTYFNPPENGAIRELQYSFPLYDGVSVVGFICRIGDRTIIGQVKERTKAKKDYKEAVARGNNAALLEQLPNASDVFTMSVGNVPAGAKVIVEITYIGELKHDAEVDGIRFTIPTAIMPRYGSYPVELAEDSLDIASERRIQITVDVVMAQESVVQQIQSPSHPIAVSLGITSIAPTADPVMSKASATLSLGSAGLEKDFILQVVAKDAGIPTAILETHPTIPNQRALMATLVPRFSLPSEKPEVVFICDCSGSMDGCNITLAKSALRVFLKSLPIGVKFNICCFGSSYSFLWTKSQTYSQNTLEEAIKHVGKIDAEMGGTEMFEPVKATLDQRCKDIPLEVILLTDGDIWDQDRLFSYLNKQVIESQDLIRVFTLGIGSGVSHSLVEGVAKAGNGFSQSVDEGEKMQSKVVRMLKGALSPHVTDYTLEVKYSDKDSVADVDDDDFEIVEKVTDSLSIKMDIADEKKALQEEQNPITLFDMSVNIDKEISSPTGGDSGEAKYVHLPSLTPPKLLQTPHIIPPLYAFNRTSVYLLLGPECSQRTPKSVVLRGTSRHGPLELEIPIQVLDTPGETIHQLAAKKAIAELEQGRGWITQVKDESGTSLQSKYSSRFADMVEREAVRLGVQFQVGGKWCSFVAVDAQKDKTKQDSVMVECAKFTDYDLCDTMEAVIVEEIAEDSVVVETAKEVVIVKETGCVSQPAVSKGTSWFRKVISAAGAVGSAASGAAGAVVHGAESAARGVGHVAGCVAVGSGAVAVGAGIAAAGALHKVDGVWKRTVQVLTTRKAHVDDICPIAKTSYVYYDEDVYDAVLTENSTGTTHVTQLIYDTETKVYYVYYRFGETDYKIDGPHSTIEAAKDAFQLTYKERFDVEWTERETAVSDRYTFETKTYETFEEVVEVEEVVDETEAECFVNTMVQTETTATATTEEAVLEHVTNDIDIVAQEEATKTVATGSKLDILIDLQTFEGFWEWQGNLFSCIDVIPEQAEKLAKDNGLEFRIVATALSIIFFEKMLAEEKDTWELMVGKAKVWMEEQIGQEKALAVLQKVVGLIVLEQAEE
ncbi:hypothetical protein BGX26_006786 [Mortierella sp. AD094]|nr:hypothetical protein BGX26_006786 [Mortierella sp. AD094]